MILDVSAGEITVTEGSDSLSVRGLEGKVRAGTLYSTPIGDTGAPFHQEPDGENHLVSIPLAGILLFLPDCSHRVQLTIHSNGVVERFFRTLKEQAIYGRAFKNLEEVRQAVADFVELYNDQWLLEKNGYRSPLQARDAYCEKAAA